MKLQESNYSVNNETFNTEKFVWFLYAEKLASYVQIFLRLWM